MNKPFVEVKKNFGFGCMRLPMKNGEVDYAEFSKMADLFIESGFNYFDTAHGYIDGKSETAIRDCVSERYERDKFLLANKLSDGFFQKEEDIRPFFEKQLEWCGVEYFDFYLMHAITAKNYDKYKKTNAYEVARSLKEEGKIRHVGMSFHDKAEFLDKILSEQSSIEFVQLQFNYADYDDTSVESYKCYEVCRKYNMPVIVMEPVKGGNLVNLPQNAKDVLDSLEGGSYASYAIRFAASFESNFMVLSGMGSMEMMEDNLSYMKDFKPLDEAEMKALEKVRGILKGMDSIACTACRYCVAGCPKKISIPDLFSCYNDKMNFGDWNSDVYYEVHTTNKGKASECIGCGKCEYECPQNLEIRELLKKVAKVFEGK